MTHDAPPGVLLCFGYGYSAACLSRRLLRRGWRVIGTTRSAGKAAELAAQGVEALIAAESDPAPALAQTATPSASAPSARASMGSPTGVPVPWPST